MKVTVYYEYLPQYEHKYWAKTTIDGSYMGACGHSWEEAKNRLLKNLGDLTMEKPPIPVEEEIELPLETFASLDPEVKTRALEAKHVS
jgi:hypothetical protein